MKNLVIRMHLQKSKHRSDNSNLQIELDKEDELFGDFNKLPDELLVKIFSYLKQKDVLNVARVSKKWNTLANDCFRWSKLSFADWKSNCNFIIH